MTHDISMTLAEYGARIKSLEDRSNKMDAKLDKISEMLSNLTILVQTMHPAGTCFPVQTGNQRIDDLHRRLESHDEKIADQRVEIAKWSAGASVVVTLVLSLVKSLFHL